MKNGSIQLGKGQHMTDFETMKDMFDRNKIEYTHTPSSQYRQLKLTVYGFGGYHVVFYFSDEGHLEEVFPRD